MPGWPGPCRRRGGARRCHHQPSPVLADLRRILYYAVGENFGYHQLGHVWRIEGLWQLVRKAEWGAMERRGLSRPGEITPAGTQSPAQLGR